MSALAEVEALAARWPAAFFAHLRLRLPSGPRDVLLGDVTAVEGGVARVHWRRSPLADVFFEARAGDAVEIEQGGRTIEATVLARRRVRFADDALVEVRDDAEGDFVRGDDDRWIAVSLGSGLPRAPVAPAHARALTLDADQRAVVAAPPEPPLRVVGRAGSGKSTALVHRLRARLRQRAASGQRTRALVLVPTEGLRRLTEDRLIALGLPDVKVRRFEAWAGRAARRVFVDLPRRWSDDTPPEALALKRHPALVVGVDAVAAAWAGRRGPVGRDALLDLFGDTAILERVVAASGGALRPGAVAAVDAHTRVQFHTRTEDDYADVVDATRLETVDGRAIDAGTPEGDARSADREDAAVLFAIERAVAARQGRRARHPPRVDVLAVDEAQDLAPIELALIASARAPGGELVVAGDDAQQIDGTAFFGGWDATMAALDAAEHKAVNLRGAHRCPPSVQAAADAVLGGGSAAAGDAVALLGFEGDGPAAAGLIEAIDAWQRAHRGASVGVLCASPGAADRVAEDLGRGLTVRRPGADGALAGRGVVVTTVEAAKGAEFDLVVLPDLGARAWPDRPEARRLLYVGLTRARCAVVGAAVGAPSPLIALTTPR
ncbi:MAG: ATP-binding domain-containing protein [Myxococcales bacterium]|nr:ATP-binding domain-containing protein [Myxococcales bacterium]